jgi:cell division transport system permease protein
MRLGFFLSEALGSMRRNWVMAMAAVITVFISTAILGAVLVTRDNLNQGATSLKNRVTIEVFIKDSASADPATLQAMENKIKGVKVNGVLAVKSYHFISKDEALKRFREKFGEGIVNNLAINPLPASYEIQVKNADQVDAVARQFFNDPSVDNDPGTHNGVKYARETVRKMLGTINLIEKGMWVVTIIFAAAAVLLISTTVRLSIFARRREVEIMRLVGATNWFIRWPFVLEGFITGLIGAVFAAVFVYVANWGIANWIKSSQIDFLNLRIFRVWWQGGAWPLGLLPTLAILGALLGAVGSLVALRRYLKT